MWSCWVDWEETSNAKCQQMTLNDEIVGFDGACKYHDYGHVMRIAEADWEETSNAECKQMTLNDQSRL